MESQSSPCRHCLSVLWNCCVHLATVVCGVWATIAPKVFSPGCRIIIYTWRCRKDIHMSKRMHSLIESPASNHTRQLILEDSGCWLGVGQWVLQKRIRNEPKSVVPCGSQVLSQWGLRVSGLRFTVSPRAITSCFAGGRFCPFGLGPMATTRHGYGSKVIGLSQKWPTKVVSLGIPWY
jgi:hypothetical protein